MKFCLPRHLIRASLLCLCCPLFATAADKPVTEEKFVIGHYRNEGFFSSLLTVIAGIMLAEKSHKVPVVYWSQEWGYGSKNDSALTNLWDYFFEPVSHLTYQAGDSITCPNPPCLHSDFHRKEGIFDLQYRLNMKQVIDKYIKVKPFILTKVDLFYENNMRGKTTIGIHLRGTDRKGDKRRYLTQFEAAEREASAAVGDVQFFVATDDESLLNLAKEVLKRPIIYCDSHRSLDGSSVHNNKKNIENGRTVLGEEALIEALLFSKCAFLVHSESCLDAAVLSFNPNLPYEFVP
jgi:hypothetical protein